MIFRRVDYESSIKNFVLASRSENFVEILRFISVLKKTKILNLLILVTLT